MSEHNLLPAVQAALATVIDPEIRRPITELGMVDQLSVDDAGVVQDIKIGGQGCSISQSSASMMSAAVKGKPIAEARKLVKAFKAMMSIHEHELGGDGEESADEDVADVKLGDLEALRGVVKFPVRIKCATLAWNTLVQGLDEAESTDA